MCGAAKSLGLWLYATASGVAPWQGPICAGSSETSSMEAEPLGEFADALDELEAAVDALARVVRSGRVDDEAEAEARAALDRLRFHPEQVALDPRAGESISVAIAWIAAHELSSGQDAVAEKWATLGLSRHGLVPVDTHGLDHPELDLLYSNVQSDLNGMSMGLVRIDCWSECMAFVDGASIGLETQV